MTRAAIYLRVSTSKQDARNQRADVLQLCKQRGYKVVRTFSETASANGPRAAFDSMKASAHAGVFDALVVWAIDRFGRSMVGNISAVLDLNRCGVAVVSVRESWLDVEGPARQLLLAVFSWVAEQERIRLGERTRAGLARAVAKGKHLGRPRRWVNVARARELLERHAHTPRTAAKVLGVPASTLRRALKRDDVARAAAAPPAIAPKRVGQKDRRK